MKKIILSITSLLLVFSIGCNIGGNNNAPGSWVNEQTGQVTFGFDQVSPEQQARNAGPGNAPTISAIVVTITDETGNVVYNAQSLAVVNMNSEYITQPLTLAVGAYNLTQFPVLYL